MMETGEIPWKEMVIILTALFPGAVVVFFWWGLSALQA
jgi:hypothetical protein